MLCSDVERSQQAMEAQNNEALERLGEKVGILKDVTLEIGRHAREDNRLLDEMVWHRYNHGIRDLTHSLCVYVCVCTYVCQGMDFDRGSNLMSATVSKLKEMMGSGGSRHMCYLALFMLFIFFVLYYAMRRSAASWILSQQLNDCQTPSTSSNSLHCTSTSHIVEQYTLLLFISLIQHCQCVHVCMFCAMAHYHIDHCYEVWHWCFMIELTFRISHIHCTWHRLTGAE